MFMVKNYTRDKITSKGQYILYGKSVGSVELPYLAAELHMTARCQPQVKENTSCCHLGIIWASETQIYTSSPYIKMS